MKAEYWFKRWREGRTRWHQNAVMPLLVRHWPALNVPRDTLVLVPFCGKSLDMIWLAEQEYRVLGVEISPLGIEQFFAENSLQADTHETPDGLRYSAGNIEIIQGNLFDVTAATLAGCNAIYDRAALIAQPASERQRYADAVYAKLPVSCRGLLITLDYPQAEMDGPPFSVDEREVRRLFGTRWDITRIERRDILADEPHFQEAGLSSLHTAVYRLRRRAD
jgi:thiopurine S-methyltransferase